jgi:GT2 family glycosyltransferase
MISLNNSLPPVSIVITSYFPESKRYLDLCMRSIESLDYQAEKEVIIVGRPDYLPEYKGATTIAPPLEKFYPPVGLNFGMKRAKHELMLVINDDTILTRHSLYKLVKLYQASPHVGLLMPTSNDSQGRYSACVGIPSRPYRYEELANRIQELIYNDGILPNIMSYHETLCIYAFLISKTNYQRVGDFDESLIGQDDIDYTLRVRQAGLANAISYSAIIYHFGGVSADKTFTPQIREESMRKFQAKWS